MRMGSSFGIRNVVWGAAYLAIAWCYGAVGAHAIRIDTFEGEQFLSMEGPGVHKASVVAAPLALGGTRSVETTSLAAGQVQSGVAYAKFYQYESVSGWGATLITWDGDLIQGLSDYAGLGGLDLTADGAKNFRLVLSFDFPADQPLDLAITVYDAGDPAGLKRSTFAAVLSNSASMLTLNLPFDQFSSGPGGAADLRRVGALTLFVKGRGSANDLEIAFLGTDGKCGDLVPLNGNVLDLCGVCGGDNSACKDCNGVPNGGVHVDACGVCGGANACLDCAGTPYGSAAVDCCGVCGGDGRSCPDKCKLYNLKAAKRSARRSMRRLCASVIKYSGQELRCSKGRRARARARMAKAKAILDKGMRLMTDTIADTVKICDTVFCRKTSLSDTLKTLRQSTARLYRLSREAQYGAGGVCPKNSQNGSAPQQTSRSDYTKAQNAIKKVPQVACSN